MFDRSFHFLRHGETDWNLNGVMQGWTDIPLNATGRAQAAAAIPALQNTGLTLIVASPLSRAHETALIVNEALKLPMHLDDRLRERGFGVLEGKAWADIEKLHPDERFADRNDIYEENGKPCPKDAETYENFKARTTTAVADHLIEASDENILFVAHGGVYRVLCRALKGETDQSPNARPYHFDKNASDWILRDLLGTPCNTK